MGVFAYQDLLEATCRELKWGAQGSVTPGKQVQEASWAAVAAITGLIGKFRGNIDAIMDNLHGQNIAQLWDHGTLLKDLTSNEKFLKILRRGMDEKQV